ncbi:hypothetical protein V9T40_000786 [Parthenolecanium corni]|uniref:Uncharacterized protein n=1 Tax=Parthenolecanium corni TaxID=536013 RepID=A0AAN9TA79_9HEMI
MLITFFDWKVLFYQHIVPTIKPPYNRQQGILHGGLKKITPDSAPCDFRLFLMLKTGLRGRDSTSDHRAVRVCMEIFKVVPLEDYEITMKPKWVQRWNFFMVIVWGQLTQLVLWQPRRHRGARVSQLTAYHGLIKSFGQHIHCRQNLMVPQKIQHLIDHLDPSIGNQLKQFPTDDEDYCLKYLHKRVGNISK